MTIQGVREGIERTARNVGSDLRTRGADALGRVGELTRGDGSGLSQGLGWFSVGLGLAELAAPEAVARFIGVEEDQDNVAVLRACGLREIASGVGILTTPQPTSLMWGRVAGDAMDLLLLGTAASAPTTHKGRLAFAAASVLGVTLLDLFTAQRLTRSNTDGRSGSNGGARRRVLPSRRERGRAGGIMGLLPHGSEQGIEVRQVVTVNRPIDEVYRFWHDFSNLARFMSHLESVEVKDGRRSIWKARGPAGTTVSWEAETTEDRPNELIAWRSLAGADVDNSGVVRFTRAPGNRGTEVRVELTYRPPAGIVGATIAKLFGEAPTQQIKGDLRRFKNVMETGEVVHSDASIHRGPHSAHPAAR
jgi:uncharacterized membrane protein